MTTTPVHWISTQTESTIEHLLAQALYSNILGENSISQEDRKVTRFLAMLWWQATHAGFFAPNEPESWKKLETIDIFNELQVPNLFHHYFKECIDHATFAEWLHEKLPLAWHRVWKRLMESTKSYDIRQIQTLLLLDAMNNLK